MSKRIYIYGASGHGLVVADVAKSCGYEDIVFLDDDKSKGFLTFDDIKENRDYHIAFGIGNNQIRAKLYKKVKENGFFTPILIHPSSIISSSAKIEEGTVIMPNHAHRLWFSYVMDGSQYHRRPWGAARQSNP
jgi:UDP-N-acetylbacillosamine N-acetyltransferase